MLDDRNDSPSAQQMRGVGIWDRSSNETGWNALLGDSVRGGPDVSAYAAPSRAADLSGLPSTFVDVGSAETFRDEDVAHASPMWRAGCHVELHVWPGGFHGFDVVVPHAVIFAGRHRCPSVMAAPSTGAYSPGKALSWARDP